MILKLLDRIKTFFVKMKVRHAISQQKKLLKKALTKGNEIQISDIINFCTALMKYNFTNIPDAPFMLVVNAMMYGYIGIDDKKVYRAFTITARKQQMNLHVVLDIDASGDNEIIHIGESRYTDKAKYLDRGRNIFFQEYTFHHSIYEDNLETAAPMITNEQRDHVKQIKALLKEAFGFIIDYLINWS